MLLLVLALALPLFARRGRVAVALRVLLLPDLLRLLLLPLLERWLLLGAPVWAPWLGEFARHRCQFVVRLADWPLGPSVAALAVSLSATIKFP